MNDLLNEDEFLPKAYDPWRYFFIYYIAAFLLSLMCTLAIRYAGPADDILNYILGFVFLVVPTTLSYLMIFRKKEVAALPLKLNTTGIAVLFLSCFLGVLCAVLFNNFNFANRIEQVWIFPLILLGIYFIVFAITAPLIRYRLKWKQKYKNGRSVTTPQ